MQYRFPIIKTIDDVKAHLDGYDEFVVVDKGDYIVINYVVANQNTFDMEGPDDLGGAIRRECRGLIFSPDGRLVSRPFHKFFNIGEREETQIHKIDMSQPHVIMEKMDGSMIRPIVVNGDLRLATKMGITDVSIQAEAWLEAQPNAETLKQWMRQHIEDSKTPIFEWVSKDNRIVIEYDNEDLVLLAIRDNESGNYSMPLDNCPFTIVPQYGSLNGNLQDYVDRQREAEGREGDIIRFANGHMLKIKNSWYVRIHKLLEKVQYDRNIVDLILNEDIDDVIAFLPQNDVNRVCDFERNFWQKFKNLEEYLVKIYQDAQKFGSRKEIATEFVPTLRSKVDAQFVFRQLDGANCRELLLDHIKKQISSNKKWEECASWMEI